ncbi:fungal-specific transcription factor domain-containing protein [Thamnidium elegans]|nr:fungal-specific transcription factor domain-containing protein [Thamnidium elegans]
MQEQELKRKRLSLACNVCRRKKIKCDGVRPSCGKCIKLNQECSYTTSIKKRGPRQGHIELLEQRLKKMEELMTTKPESPTHIVPVVTELVEFQQTTSPMQQSSMTIQTQQPMSIIQPQQNMPIIQPQQNMPTIQPQHNVPILLSEQSVSSCGLPCDEILEHIIDLYFYNCATISPIIDAKGFKYSVKNKTCNLFLLYALLAVGSRFSNRPDIADSPLWMSGERYASKAREMIPQVIEMASLDHVQGLLILSVNEYGCARGPRSWTYVGLATRMAIEINLYKETIFEEESNSVLSLDKWYAYETKRKTFWEAFMHDKLSSADTGRPGTLDPNDCEIMLPVDISIFDSTSGNDFYQSSLDQSHLVHYHIIRDEITNQITGIQMNPLDVNLPEHRVYLNRVGWTSRIIKEGELLFKITRLVNKGYKSDRVYVPYEDNSEFNKLDKELDGWISNLPLQIRNTPANLERYRSQNNVRSVQYVLGHILHNSLVILLHRPSIVIADMPDLSHVPQKIQDRVHQSVEKCLAAADNVTVMLKDLCCQIQAIPPYMSYSVYIAATIVINSNFTMNLRETQKAESALKEYFHFLTQMKEYWAMADKLYFMVCDLYAIHKKVLDTCQKNQAATSSGGSSASSWNLNSYQANSNIPMARRPLENISLSSNDYTDNQNWNSEDNGFLSPHQGRVRSIFSDPSDPSYAMPSFDIWLQQQQQQQQQQLQQQQQQQQQQQ